MRAEGIYDVDANTSIDQLSEELNIKMAEVIYSVAVSLVCPSRKKNRSLRLLVGRV